MQRMAILSVAWVIANPATTSVIFLGGGSRIEQLTDMLAVADYKFDGRLKAKLDGHSIEYRRVDSAK